MNTAIRCRRCGTTGMVCVICSACPKHHTDKYMPRYQYLEVEG